MARHGFVFTSRSSMTFLIRAALLTSFLGLVAYKVGIIPLDDLWSVRKPKTSVDSSNMLVQPPYSGHKVRQFSPALESGTDSNVSQPACVFPKLELYDPEIMKFFHKYDRLKCDTEPDWIYIQNGKFILSEIAHKNHPDIHCDAHPIVKVTDFKVDESDPVKDVKNNTPITNDFYRVHCSSSDGKTFKSYLAGIRRDKEVQNRPISKLTTGLDVDVIMIGFDSTSRLAWLRHLPKSRDYFINVLKGTEMEGYNILGDGTPAAIMPILIGLREEELHEARKNYPSATPVDDFPWIWNEFRSAGYALAWAEDDAYLGTFQYRLLGFKEQPTDHYFRYYCVAAEPNYHMFLPDCMGARPRHSVVLDYMNEMFSMYPDRRKWMFSFQAQLSHKDNNLLSKMDDDLLEHMKRMHQEKNLDNAVFIMLADHGGRFSKVRTTAQGKQEERLPYFAIRFPEWFHHKHPEIVRNVKINSKRLMTPFDVHETLHEILNFTGAGLADISKRGVSIFKEIPAERDCQAAHIDPHWCTCLDWQEVDVDSDPVKKVVAKVIDTFNNYTAPYRNLCSLLSVSKVVSAAALKVNDAVLKFKETNDGGRGRFGAMTDTTKHSKIIYQVTLFTHPGGGRFEVTLTHNLLKNTLTLDPKDISRTNEYGSQPKCVEHRDAFLRPYCFCKNLGHE